MQPGGQLRSVCEKETSLAELEKKFPIEKLSIQRLTLRAIMFCKYLRCDSHTFGGRKSVLFTSLSKLINPTEKKSAAIFTLAHGLNSSLRLYQNIQTRFSQLVAECFYAVTSSLHTGNEKWHCISGLLKTSLYITVSH